MSLQWTVHNSLVALTRAASVAVGLLALRGGWWFVNMLWVLPRSDPLQYLPGPDGPAMKSMLPDVLEPSRSPRTHKDWQEKYGKTLRFHGFGRHDYRVLSLDFQVITHVLTSPLYEKPWQTRSMLARLIGKGIFSTEGAEHKFQRKLIAPAFSTQSVRNMLPIFLQKAEQLSDRWQDIILVDGPTTTSTPSTSESSLVLVDNEEKHLAPSGIVIDVLHWMSRASFDVIGLSGFDYSFDSLNDETEEVYVAYRRMFDVLDKVGMLRMVTELYFPIIRTIWPDERTKITNKSLELVAKAGKEIVERKKADVLAESSGNVKQKDILSLLIKANLSSDPSNRFSDAELLDQCSTFLLVGADTASLGITWALYYLSLHPDMQQRLRTELINELDHPLDLNSVTSLDKIDNIAYLDAVVRETLRFCPPIHSSIRVASADDHIPISYPMQMRDGTVLQPGETFRIRKGSYVHIPIEGLNLSPEIWGEDGLSFNPDRWLNGKPTPNIVHPGLGNVMSFGFGSSSCLGFKFTIFQMKAFLATILPRFSFAPVEGIQISKFNTIVTRPYVKGKWDEQGAQLPLVVREYQI